MGKISSAEIRNAIKGEISSLQIPDIRTLVNGLKSELMSQIRNADMPEGVKNALLNSISFIIHGDDRATVTVRAMRESIYAPIGLYTDPVDLALIYDKRNRIKSSAVFYDHADSKLFIPIGRIEGFAQSYQNLYLRKTANAFMAKHPECIVTVSKTMSK